ncbi:uncharacterized protein KIAA1755 homolog [Thalassophryne amazonica]|uniref:uncharacterized protein KIAA1755 homolog n=1 Tax=Thalassophryne amazonica TaxID=390379 RepID=UPI001470D0A1|nr:uncharacterized protein KIAA1755 homolog [Thalassophryne amazonica]
MNPESLDSSIQSALSALFPPFEATAPIVLSQLFRTIEERYYGDALQCLIDFLIPSKHLLESVQQAACAGFSDVLFRCEGWPLCLHDKTVIQLAPLNPLLLRPGDFYLQVEPFGDQAARIVLKSLLEEGCREVEETPVCETSYSCIFTEEWLQDINEDRHGTPLSRCLLCTDQGVIKLPWAKIAIPEFLDKPKIMPTSSSAFPSEPKQVPVPSHFSSSTLPLEDVLPEMDRKTSSSKPVGYSSKLVKMDHDKRTHRSRTKPLMKPVGWVSPNTWDSHNNRELEGDYVDLMDLAKGNDNHPSSPNSCLLKPARPPSAVPVETSAQCGHVVNPCTPCSQRTLGLDSTDQYLQCRYRDSYMAALKNPFTFEKVSVDLLSVVEEVSLCEDGELRSKDTYEAQRENTCGHCNKPVMRHEPCQNRHSCDPTPETVISRGSGSENLFKEPATALKSSPGLNHCQRTQIKGFLHQLGYDLKGYPSPVQTCDGNMTSQQKVEVVKPSGKHKVKLRSRSTVSETPKGNPMLHQPTSRAHSDVGPEVIMQCRQHSLFNQVSPKLERRQSPKKESQPRKNDILSNTDGQHTSTSPEVQLPSASSDMLVSSQTKESSFRCISSLLELGIIYLPGSRDRTGRAVVEVHADRKEWASPIISAQNVCELLLYLHSIPRKDVRELGMTLLINARKKPPSPHFYKALLMAQEQALHTVHSVLVLVDKDTSPRPEKQPGLQMDIVTSMKVLSKTVDASQLTSDLGGTFTYSHTDWLQFHQRLVSFKSSLWAADSLLQKAIQNVDGSKRMDSAQDVQRCIHEQKASMKEVLEDTRLVTLQREGGALLARMRREEFRFPQSEDYRDALESVTSLYNQVEEKLHTLVMRSNESLQQLEFLFRLREMEGKISTVGMWFNTEGEQKLKDSYMTEDTLVCTEKTLEHFDRFVTQSKEKQQYALMLVMEAEKIAKSGDSTPTTEIFQTLVSTFKSNMDDFMFRIEQRRKDLDTLVHVHRFCDQALSLTKECSDFLKQVENGSNSAQACLTTLHAYEERLSGEFSTTHFQAVKSKACALGSAALGVITVWRAALMRCQEVRERLEEMQEKNARDKNQNLPDIPADCQEKAGEIKKEERNEMGEAKYSLKEDQRRNSAPESNTVVGFNYQFKMALHRSDEGESLHQKSVENVKMTLVSPQDPDGPPETTWKPREHHSEADLRSVDSADGGFKLHQALGRSLSEGSAVRSHMMCLSSFSPLIVRHKHCDSRMQPLVHNVQTPPNLHFSHNESLLPGYTNSGSNEQQAERCTGPTQSSDFRTQEALHKDTEHNGPNVLKLQRIIEELLTTEREYVRALGYVREHYFPEVDRPDVPQDLRGQKGSIFGNLEKLHDFHRHHFLNELESCVDEPLRVGRCFLRHRESFALYAHYSKNKPQSDSLLINHGQVFFKQKQLKLVDKMDLWSYLLKPVQRISKYSLLLQDMMKECGPRQIREMAEVQAALEVVHFQLRHGNNLLAMDAILHCDVNLKEQGQLMLQDEFFVTFRKKKCFRHIFLFQELILFSKTKKTDVGNDTYVYKQSFKTSDIGITQNSGETGLCFEIWFRKRKTQDTYTLQAVSREVKDSWTRDLERILWEQAVHNREVRMQERVFMGIGNKPFIDIQPSEAAISDRAVNYVLIGRENKLLSSVGHCGPQDGLNGGRPKSVGSGSSSSSSGSHSSSSSGRGSMSPVGYLCVPKRRVLTGSIAGYVSPPGVLEVDDLDHESGSQNLLLDSSESSGDSISGFSSSGHSCRSAVGAEGEDTSSICTSIITAKETVVDHQAEASTNLHKPDRLVECPEETQPPDASVSKPRTPCQANSRHSDKETTAGKSTEV